MWLPPATGRYWTKQVPFLAGDPLRPHEEERYDLYPSTADDWLRSWSTAAAPWPRALTAGPHGIPLMGAGDWNDGMNRVGIEGKGESIWLGWFACATLEAFATMLLAGDAGERVRLPPTGTGRRSTAGDRTAWLGRRVVSARLLRRRFAAWFGAEQGMPHRRDRPVLGCAIRRR